VEYTFVSEENLARQLEGTLESLPEASEVAASRPSADARYDYLMEFRLAGEPVRLLVECKRAAYPRDVRELAPRWGELARSMKAVPLLATGSLSAPLREQLRQLNVGYFDLGGSLYLPLKRGGYILVDRPPPPRRTGQADVFEGKAQRIVHQLLHEHEEWHPVTLLAHQCGVAPSTASRTLAELERHGWVEARDVGPRKKRRAVHPGELLDAWADAVTRRPAPPLERFFIPGAVGLEALLKRVSDAFMSKVPYAVTHQAAAQVYAPFLTEVRKVRLRAVVGSALTEALADMHAQKVEEGSNLEIIPVADPLDAFTSEARNGIHLASPVQVYIDLQGGEGRSKEAADHLRREAIGF
jgi:DNA-binding transcriptional ArsR family regulator